MTLGVGAVVALTGCGRGPVSLARQEPDTASSAAATTPTEPAPPAGKVPDRVLVSFTFDDGKKDQYLNAMPVLDRAGFKGTFYIIGGAVDDWPKYRADYMTAAEVKDLSTRHEVGNHTWDHENLVDLTRNKTPLTAENDVRSQLKKTQEKLAKVVGTPPKTCAYPFGGADEVVVKVAKQYLSGCRTTTSGLNLPSDDPHLLKIYYMDSKTTLKGLAKALSDAKRQNKWLILCYHSVRQVDDPKDNLDVTAAAFRSQVAAVKRSGVPVMTVAQALGLS
jgi:hypothetical protein